MTIIDEAREFIQKSWAQQDFNHLALSFFDLKKGTNESIEFHQGIEEHIPHFYYDLASLTKILTMGALWAKDSSLFKGEKRLLLEHRGGLPRWAILGKSSWQETVLKFPIKESETEYSDLSMLRLMLILEKETGKNFKDIVDYYWQDELCFWKDLPENALCPDTGYRQGEVVKGEVNDDNCFKINRFCSHAGLFATLDGLVNSLIELQKQTGLLEKMEKAFDKEKRDRFLFGWDTVSDPQETLAGIQAPPHTFGHLGFTGTSIWIDADSGKGWTLLTNATRKYWFNRRHLAELRKSLGGLLWQSL